MSHPPEHVSDLENNLGKGGKSNKNDKKKVRLNFNFKKHLNIRSL